MSEWRELKLSEIAGLRREGFKPDQLHTLPYIGLEHIEAKGLRLNSIGNSTEVTSQKSKFFPNDILYGKLRPYFQKVYNPSFEGVCSTDIFVIKAKKEIDSKFLFYLIASDEFTNLANNGSTGTRMPRADWKHLSSTFWNIPDLPTQKAIAEILSSLDDKIELNNQINQNLEALAQALFKQWFVDFEFPNENGEPYKSSGGEMIDSELGEIPKGWKIESLSKIASLEKSSVKPFEKPNEDFFHYSLPEFDSGKIPSIEKGEVILSSKYKVISNSILFSKLNPRIPRVWPIIDCKLNSVCSTEFQVIKPEKEKYFSFINSLLNSEEYIKSIQSKVTGTSSSHQRVNPKDIINHLFPLPEQSIIELFHSSTFHFFEKVFDHRSENEKLKTLRDTLLPKLISGELEVSEASLEPTF